MRYKIISILAVFGIVAGLSLEASAASVTDWISAAKAKGADSFCAPTGVSVRRAEGIACKNKLVAALAVYLCYDNAKNKEGFRAGKCYGRAESLLGKGVDKAKAKTVLLEEAKKLGGTLKDKIEGLVK